LADEWLEISFYGPFFYDLRAETCKNKHVLIYAPKCPGHKAGIFSATNEAPLRSRVKSGYGLTYAVSGKVFKKPDEDQPPQYKTKNLKVVDPGSTWTPYYKTVGFVLQLPVPQYIYAMNPSPALEIVKQPTPTGLNLAQYATGMRFYYEADLSKQIYAYVKGYEKGSVFKSKFEETYPNRRSANVFVRYAGTTPEDPDHDDAVQCFGLITELCGLDWWLCYENWADSGFSSSFVRTGDDCRAPVIVAT
jgi:hypothetical protein